MGDRLRRSKRIREIRMSKSPDRLEVKDDVCHQCGERSDLFSCTTCTYAYHKRCLYPVSRTGISESWSCPECVSPLTEIEKILDFENRPALAEAQEGSSKPSLIKTPWRYYLVKWKGLSYLHCTWVSEEEFTKASGVYPGLKGLLNTFHKQMESNTEDDWVPIRPEFTIADSIIDSRKKGDECEYFVKWKEFDYDECTWEVESDISAFKYLIERYILNETREQHPLMEGEGRSLKVLGFNQNQRSLFKQLIMRFGFQDFTWRQFAPKFKGKTLKEVHEYAKLFMKHIREDANDSPTFSDGVPKEGARVNDISIRVRNIQLIEEKVQCIMSSNPGEQDMSAMFPGINVRFWKREQDIMLLKAILKHGYARWQDIIKDASTGIAEFARKELSLPSVPFPETVQTKGATTANANGKKEMKQYRELQRRLVEFIRKRYYILEKALNHEDCQKLLKAKFEAQYQQADQDPALH